MEIIQVSFAMVEIKDETGYRSLVFLQGDGKWKCLRCNRFTCEHVKFVAEQNPTLPEPVELSREEINQIIDDD
jgi:hypothetical protein